jgi:DNA-binding LytR/AlgR family response regulator
MFEKNLSSTHDPLPRAEATWTKPPRIAIKAKGKILFMDPADVVTVEARGNYVLLQRLSGSDLLRESMSTVAEKLRPFGFVRIHRSVLINASFVEEIHPCITGDYVLRIKGGREFNVSRTFKKNLYSITPLWIGTDGFRAG